MYRHHVMKTNLNKALQFIEESRDLIKQAQGNLAYPRPIRNALDEYNKEI